jgi:hypothetical protein
LNIDEFVKNLKSAYAALDSAPQKGFVDLDLIKSTIQCTRLFLEKNTPRIQLGERLINDFREELLARLKVLKTAGASSLFTQAEQLLADENPDFDKLKALQLEIDESLKKMFAGQTKYADLAGQTRQNLPPRPADYR